MKQKNTYPIFFLLFWSFLFLIGFPVHAQDSIPTSDDFTTSSPFFQERTLFGDEGAAEKIPQETDTQPFYITFFHLDEIGKNISLGDASPTQIVVRLINVALSFLGIIFVVIVIYTGFLFLFSFGKEERLAQAKRAFLNALIGLIIIISSYSIVQFILEAFGPLENVEPDPILDGGEE